MRVVRYILSDQAGYSLVEVVVAIMLLSIAIIPMVGMFDAGLRAVVVGSNYDKARAAASEELEEIRTLPYSSPDDLALGTDNSVVEIYPPVNGPSGAGPVACTGAIPSGFDCRVETTYVVVDATGITLDPDARSMMQVEVTVEWNGSSNSYTTMGLVSKDTP